MIIKALVILMLIAMAEVLHGVLRVSLLNRRVGDHCARQIGVFTGSVIILIISWLGVALSLWLNQSKHSLDATNRASSSSLQQFWNCMAFVTGGNISGVRCVWITWK